jgi:RND family efflux transporter MFP subunit
MNKRLTVMTALVLLVAFAAASAHWMWPAARALDSAQPSGDVAQRVPVVLTAVRDMLFENTVSISGSIQTKHWALVSARMPGVLDAVNVDRGDSVQADQTELFQTDSLKLTKAAAIARQGLQVAELSVKEKRANFEQAVASQELAELDLERYRALLRENAVPRQMFDQQETRFKQASAMVRHAEALLELDRSKLEQASLQLLIAEKDLADSLVLAPISGKVTERFMEPGEMAAPGSPVLKVEDLSLLEISVFLPEEHFAQVEPGRTQMRVTTAGKDLGVRPIVYKSPTIHRKLRTFEVKALVDSAETGVAPGSLAEAIIVLDARRARGVPASAVQQRGEGAVVFIVESDLARMIPVTTGRSSEGWIEILDGRLPADAQVVTMGQQLISDSSPVVAVKEDGR